MLSSPGSYSWCDFQLVDSCQTSEQAREARKRFCCDSGYGRLGGIEWDRKRCRRAADKLFAKWDQQRQRQHGRTGSELTAKDPERPDGEEGPPQFSLLTQRGNQIWHGMTDAVNAASRSEGGSQTGDVRPPHGMTAVVARLAAAAAA